MSHVGGGYGLLILYAALFNIRYRVVFFKFGDARVTRS